MNFTKALKNLKLVRAIIKKQLVIEGVKYEEDIIDRDVRWMFHLEGALSRIVNEECPLGGDEATLEMFKDRLVD